MHLELFYRKKEVARVPLIQNAETPNKIERNFNKASGTANSRLVHLFLPVAW